MDPFDLLNQKTSVLERLGVLKPQYALEDVEEIDAENRKSVILGSLAQRKFSSYLECDRIQELPPGEFDSTLLTFTGTTYLEAWIPEDRFADFLRGEEHRDRFHSLHETKDCAP